MHADLLDEKNNIVDSLRESQNSLRDEIDAKRVPDSKTNESHVPADNIYADIYRNRFLDTDMKWNGKVPEDLTPKTDLLVDKRFQCFQLYYQLESTPEMAEERRQAIKEMCGFDVKSMS